MRKSFLFLAVSVSVLFCAAPRIHAGGIIMQHPFAYYSADYTSNLEHRWYADANVSATGVTVSGAGTAAVNGTYAYTGTYNSENYYRLDASHFLYYEDFTYTWVLGSALGGGTTYYGTYDADIDGASWGVDGGTGPGPSTAWSGGTWSDAAASQDMTVFGDAAVATATPGLTMDGTLDYADGAALNITAAGDWSMTMWVKTSATGNKCLLAYSANEVLSPGTEGDFYLYTPDSLKWGGIGKSAEVNSSQDLADNAWHFIAITKSSTQTILYVDGSTTAAYTDTHKNTARAYTGAKFRIGDDLNISFFSGVLDDVRIYSAELTPAQQKQIYNATSASY